ncbi:aminoglycoside phosphotransferase [Paenibacillus zeisoli]|uniref:Aminoglycoside phosphotransferase n=1 Tax=Paenibacillus zeisoli TaxID=2496267 RepID=A0A3S1BBG3_9BACL|nr:phosphotransferase [Paenibacillus zeisoli]RUT35558.1 aminoglycoside phosphotransferase [Paenibacillus zeisoli]
MKEGQERKMCVLQEDQELEFYYELASRALNNYNMPETTVYFLQKSDTVTFKLESSSGVYLLKIHNQAQTRESIESELRWLQAIKEDTDLVVSEPYLNIKGHLVTEIMRGDTPFLVTIQHWIEGEVLNREPTAEEALALGRLISTLHKHSREWERPEGFSRVSYDLEQLDATVQAMQALVTHGIIADNVYVIYQETVRMMKIEIEAFPKSEANWGLIHSDLHESNYVVHHDRISPIDFSACGFGYYLLDLAETCQHLSRENRRILVHAYGEQIKLPDQLDRLLEAFILWAVIRGFAFHAGNPDEREYLSETVPAIAEAWCSKYLQDVRFLFTG